MSEPHDSGNHVASRVARIHGILVADDGYGDIYMIPLADILDDIKQGLDVSSVSLPHDTNEILQLLQLERFSLDTSVSGATSSSNTTNFTASVSVRAQGSSSNDALVASSHSVWYCSQCGDGPIGSWNPGCNSCGHMCCEACTIARS